MYRQKISKYLILDYMPLYVKIIIRRRKRRRRREEEEEEEI